MARVCAVTPVFQQRGTPRRVRAPDAVSRRTACSCSGKHCQPCESEGFGLVSKFAAVVPGFDRCHGTPEWRRGARERWCGGLVAVAGRGPDFDSVTWSWPWLDGPTGGFFGVVAGLAEPGAVVAGGWSAAVPGNDVVQVPDRGVAVGGPAGVVPGLDEAAEPGREEPRAGVHPRELAGAGGGVEPAEPDVE